MNLQNKWTMLWDRFPSEVRASIWIILAYTLSELVIYLEAVQTEDRIIMAVANIVLYFAVNRRQVITSRFK